MVGLEWARRRQLKEYSKGMVRRIGLAQALINDPELILLDEPTTGLDPKSKRDVQGFIERLMAEHEATIVLCTHDMEEAERLCHQVAVMDDGRIVAEGTPAELRARAGKTAPGDKFEEVFIELTGHTMEDAEQAKLDEEVA